MTPKPATLKRSQVKPTWLSPAQHKADDTVLTFVASETCLVVTDNKGATQRRVNKLNLLGSTRNEGECQVSL